MPPCISSVFLLSAFLDASSLTDSRLEWVVVFSGSAIVRCMLDLSSVGLPSHGTGILLILVGVYILVWSSSALPSPHVEDRLIRSPICLPPPSVRRYEGSLKGSSTNLSEQCYQCGFGHFKCGVEQLDLAAAKDPVGDGEGGPCVVEVKSQSPVFDVNEIWTRDRKRAPRRFSSSSLCSEIFYLFPLKPRKECPTLSWPPGALFII
ncbi:hypothetical protein VNO77_34360 [Canavalia gladiata]|uniref:Uncharacterized protein n=1 Tax=Canavalia gladiata TaxID=3824 RepID=A0AAN9PX62_CANGL